MTVSSEPQFSDSLVRLPQQRARQRLRRYASLEQAARTPRSDALRWLPAVALGLDLTVVTVALAAASTLSGPSRQWFGGGALDYVPGLAVAGPLVLVAWILMIAVGGGYDSRVFGATTEEFTRVLRASIACAALVGVGCYMIRFELSRGWFVLTFSLGTAFILTGRYAFRRWLKSSRSRGHLRLRVLIIGDTTHIDAVAAVLEREAWLGYDVIGALAPLSEGSETTSGIDLLGDLSDIPGTVRKVGADVALVAGGAVTSPEHLREIAWELEYAHAQLMVVPSVTDVARERVQVRPVGGLPLIHLEKPCAAKAARLAKRGFDALGATLLLVLASPLLAWCAASIWLHDRGPVLFRQERVGRDGDAFTCLKFRTMAVDAEAKLAEVLAAEGLRHGAFAKLKVDPRITRPGAWLRRYSLDELPQLFNVLSGHMSLVGPRPQTPLEVQAYDGAMSRRLHVRPGMTGLWQVSGRSDLSVEESMRLDLYYVDNWSMMQDVSILARTVGAVAASRGAY